METEREKTFQEMIDEGIEKAFEKYLKQILDARQKERIWLSAKQISELVSTKPATVLRWCRRHEAPLPHKREGRVIRINENDFWNWWNRDYNKPKQRVQKLVDL